MTTSQLEALNRKNSYAGVGVDGDTQRPLRPWGEASKTSRSCATSENPAGSIPARQQSLAAWDEICRNLDLWNAAHGRTRRADA